MSMLERYAEQREQTFEKLKSALIGEFDRGELTKEQLHLGMKKSIPTRTSCRALPGRNIQN